jgi:hypothetical protein
MTDFHKSAALKLLCGLYMLCLFSKAFLKSRFPTRNFQYKYRSYLKFFNNNIEVKSSDKVVII